jgi:hypothetical protein
MAHAMVCVFTNHLISVSEDTIVVNLREKGRIENEISGWRIYPYRDKSISFLPMVILFI